MFWTYIKKRLAPVIQFCVLIFATFSLIVLSGISIFTLPCLLLAGVPFFIITGRYKRLIPLYGILILGVTALDTFSIPMIVIFLLIFCVTGMVDYIITEKTDSFVNYMAAGTLFSIVIKILALACSVIFIKVNPFVVTTEMANGMAELYKTILSGAGKSVSDVAVNEFINYAKILPTLMMPTVIIGLSACDTYISYRVGRKYLGGSKSKLPQTPEFSTWRCSRQILWAFIAVIISELALGINENLSFLEMFSFNLMEIIRLVLLVEGLAVIWYFMTRKRVHGIVKVGAMILLTLMPPMSYMVSMLGIFDIWYDLRKNKQGGNNNESNTD